MRRSVAVLLGCLAGLGSAGCVSVHPAGGDVCAGPAAERPASCGPDDAGEGTEGAGGAGGAEGTDPAPRCREGPSVSVRRQGLEPRTR
ncbi:hypothetical protein [Streptomyces harbinensis]|uniref:hypothetical protein n=1 Tax=Streptomyces harbinensis TaxID=1176198 RepID=UPI0034DE9058